MIKSALLSLCATPLLFSAVVAAAAKPNPSRIYKDVDKVSVFHQQGKTIFNTSMPNCGCEHFYTDNNGKSAVSNGPTSIWQRDKKSAAPIALKNLNIPADVHISPDGNTLYAVDYGLEHSQIFKMQRTDKGWSDPIAAKELNREKGSGYPTSTNTGEFVFSSEGDIFFYDGKKHSRLPKEINSADGEHDPFIAQDGSFLMFVRQIPDKGDSNMFISFRQGNGWTPAKMLPAPFNKEKVDGSPYVTPDKMYLFFSSNRDGEVLRTYQAPFKAFYEREKIRF